MKRSPELAQLSREHYHALKLALDARRAAESGAPGNLAAMAIAIRQTALAELEPHFKEEEERLLPALAAAGCGELVALTLEDHRQLRQAIAALADPSPSALLHFAELLQGHVRFEERELFQVAQERLDAAALAALLKG